MGKILADLSALFLDVVGKNWDAVTVQLVTLVEDVLLVLPHSVQPNAKKSLLDKLNAFKVDTAGPDEHKMFTK